MEQCPRCGKPGHDASACLAVTGTSSLPPSLASLLSLPALSGALPPGAPSGEFTLSGAYATSQNPIHRSLRLLKTQLNLAIGQREEDPERAWLEALSVRERIEALAEGAKEDPLLAADVDRFRTRLHEALKKLTRDVGDEVVAPLYSWVDLVRQRERLEGEVLTAQSRVAEARASRGAADSPVAASADAAAEALDAREKELAWWRAETPAPPTPEALAVWNAAGGEALRASMPADAKGVLARGRAGRSIVDPARGRPLGLAPYAGSRAEWIAVPSAGAVALLSSAFAFSMEKPPIGLAGLAVLACGSLGAIAMASVQARRRAILERRAAIDVVWHHTLFTEQAASLDLEVGWLRALNASLRARAAFDAHKGEGGQLAELTKWRPDLKEVVADVAKSSLAPPVF
jgi:hypothetical protein